MTGVKFDQKLEFDRRHGAAREKVFFHVQNIKINPNIFFKLWNFIFNLFKYIIYI